MPTEAPPTWEDSEEVSAGPSWDETTPFTPIDPATVNLKDPSTVYARRRLEHPTEEPMGLFGPRVPEEAERLVKWAGGEAPFKLPRFTGSDTAGKLAAPVLNLPLEFAEQLETPIGWAPFGLPGKLVRPAFAGMAGYGAIKAGQEAYRTGDIQAGAQAAVDAALAGLLLHGKLPLVRRPGELPGQLQGPPATGEFLRMPEGAAPIIPRSAELTGPAVPDRFRRPEVPGTPAEPRLSIEEQIRAKGARTKEEIRKIFPDLTREEAAAARDRAWGKGAEPEAAPAEPPTPAEPPVKKKTPRERALIQKWEGIHKDAIAAGDNIMEVKAAEKLKRLGAAVPTFEETKPIEPPPEPPAAPAAPAAPPPEPTPPPAAPTAKPLPSFDEVKTKVNRGEPLSANEQAVWNEHMVVGSPTAAAAVADYTDIEQANKLSATDLMQALKAKGKGTTAGAYDLGEKLTPESRAKARQYEQAADKEAMDSLARAKAEPDRAKGLQILQRESFPAQQKKQFFNEAGRFYDAVQDVKSGKPLEQAAIDHGVDENVLRRVAEAAPAEAAATLEPKPGYVRLYHGEGATAGAGAGGSWFTDKPDYAAQFGKVSFVDVPADVAAKAREAVRQTGTGGPHFIIPDEYVKQAKEMATQPGAKVFDVTEEPAAAEPPTPGTIEATPIAGKTLGDWEQATDVSQLPKGTPRAELAKYLAVPNQPSRILAALKNKKRTREIHAPPPTAAAPDIESQVQELYENPDPTQAELTALTAKLSDADKSKYSAALGAIQRRIEKAAGVAELNKRMQAPDTGVDIGHPPEESITTTEPGAKAPAKPKVEKAPDFESYGNWKVTLPDGSVKFMFFDRDTAGGMWRESDGKSGVGRILSGLNKEDAIAKLATGEKIVPPAAPAAPEAPEKIVAAAYQPRPGITETGANHPEILKRLGVTGFESPESRNTPQFGFQTDKRGFITREEAGPIAEKSGQNLKEFEPGEPVHSNEVASPTQPEKPLSETTKPKFQMTFEQFLNAPREGELLDELRKVPKSEMSPERKAAREKYDKAFEALEKANLGWTLTDHPQTDLAIRNLSKKNQAIVKRYNDALNADAAISARESQARQRVLYDDLVKRGVIDPTPPPEQLAGPGSPAAGQGPDPVVTGLSAGSPGFNSIARKLRNFYTGIGQLFKRGADKQTLAQLTNAADNIPRIEGQRAGNTIRNRTDAKEQNAITFVMQALKMSGEGISVEATERLGELEFLGDPKGYLETKATDMETKAQEFLHNGQKLEAQAAIDAARHMRYAKNNFGRLRQYAELARKKFDAQYQREQDANIAGDYENWHVPQRHDLDLMTSSDRPIILGHSKGTGTATGFRKAKVFEDYATAIENGFVPRSFNIADLLEHRVNQGERLIQRKALFDRMKSMADPVDGRPIAQSIPKRQITRPDGTIDTQESVPRGYQSFEVLPGYRIAVHDGYAPMMRALTGTSQISESAVVGTLQDIAGVNKHLALALDTFHASRIMQAELALTGKLSVGARQRIGRALVEYDPRDLGAAVRKGEITQEMADYITTPQPMQIGGRTINVSPAGLVKMGIQNGLNAGRFSDALYRDWIREIPITGDVNKWVFDKLSRSAITHGFLAEFERVARNNPELNATQVARRVASDINVLFGNLQKESIFRNPSVKAVNQILFLAPNWVEALARREIRAVRQFAELPAQLARGEAPRLGTVGRGIGHGLAAYFVGTQVLNLITRGQLTFSNPEPGHKLDAWIPDVGGKTKGFFISPLSVFGEIAHDILRYSREKADVASALTQIGANKMGNMGRMVEVLATGRDPASGEKLLGTSRRAIAAGMQMVPVPISLSQGLRAAGAAAAPGLISPPAPGAMQRQLFASAGLKTEPAGTAQRQIYTLADKWKSQSGSAKIRAEVERRLKEDFGPSDYKDLRTALLRNDLSGARRAFDDLRKTKEPQVINRAMRHPHPFTGNAQAERAFVRSLSDEDKKLYREALEERKLLYSRYRQMLAQ